jgi:lambda family phage portal protein
MIDRVREAWRSLVRGERRFNAAQYDRSNSDWVLTPIKANEDIRNSLKVLVSRSRDLAKNNSDYRKFLNMRRRNVVGSEGLRLQAKAHEMDGRQDTVANYILENEWREWGKAVSACGKHTWNSFCELVDRTQAVDGEAFVRIIRGRAAGNPWGLALQLVDSMLIDIDYNEAKGGKLVVMGVEIDEYERPVRYWMRKQEPTAYGGYGYGERVAIPAEDIIHLYTQEFAGQVRGFPSSCAAILDLNMQAGFREASLIAARVAACQMGVWIRPVNTSGKLQFDTAAADGEKAMMDFEPGKFSIAPKGWDFKQLTPSHPANMAADFMKAVSRSVANGLDVAYNDFANDLEGVSFSSIRSGTLAERDGWKIDQRRLIDAFCNPVFGAWLEQFLLSGKSPLPFAKITKFSQVVFVPRRWDWVDPLRDVKADREAIDLHVMSPQDIIREGGRDPDEVLEEIAEWGEKLAKYNLNKQEAANGQETQN